jgi:hypothetical protein
VRLFLLPEIRLRQFDPSTLPRQSVLIARSAPPRFVFLSTGIGLASALGYALGLAAALGLILVLTAGGAAP